eukprot:TRINITY_DN20159_c0_g2_i1.p1 TRINITY_DN20159_c0_g2~~TRINITY_DN20159_c0_g2_i1.p1  ORF type:complete len:242 (-),score=31.60 TRINITY_DN20159_c0_g2_i1:115-780(-)
MCIRDREYSKSKSPQIFILSETTSYNSSQSKGNAGTANESHLLVNNHLNVLTSNTNIAVDSKALANIPEVKQDNNNTWSDVTDEDENGRSCEASLTHTMDSISGLYRQKIQPCAEKIYRILCVISAILFLPVIRLVEVTITWCLDMIFGLTNFFVNRVLEPVFLFPVGCLYFTTKKLCDVTNEYFEKISHGLCKCMDSLSKRRRVTFRSQTSSLSNRSVRP